MVSKDEIKFWEEYLNLLTYWNNAHSWIHECIGLERIFDADFIPNIDNMWFQLLTFMNWFTFILFYFRLKCSCSSCWYLVQNCIYFKHIHYFSPVHVNFYKFKQYHTFPLCTHTLRNKKKKCINEVDASVGETDKHIYIKVKHLKVHIIGFFFQIRYCHDSRRSSDVKMNFAFFTKSM